MQAERGKHGQYIGKVELGSPAEAAGLRNGDRIVEVNGSRIDQDTHKQVRAKQRQSRSRLSLHEITSYTAGCVIWQYDKYNLK